LVSTLFQDHCREVLQVLNHFLQFPTTLIPRTAADAASSGKVGDKMHLCGAGQDQTEMTSEKPTDEFHNISQLKNHVNHRFKSNVITPNSEL
jgi:hypothetical protein